MGYIKRMAKKIGRPAIPKSQRRSVFLRVRITRAERDALRKAAKAAGLSLSNYLRQKINS